MFLGHQQTNITMSIPPIGQGRDAGPSSSGNQKKQHLKGDWVRGHQKDSGIYAREMPHRITGNTKTKRPKNKTLNRHIVLSLQPM